MTPPILFISSVSGRLLACHQFLCNRNMWGHRTTTPNITFSFKNHLHLNQQTFWAGVNKPFCLRRVQNSINNCHTTHRLPYKEALHRLPLVHLRQLQPLKSHNHLLGPRLSLDTNFLLRCFFFSRGQEAIKKSPLLDCWTPTSGERGTLTRNFLSQRLQESNLSCSHVPHILWHDYFAFQGKANTFEAEFPLWRWKWRDGQHCFIYKLSITIFLRELLPC